MPLVSASQDAQFSQFYAAPLYTNPAFTGLTGQHRFVANIRDQWPGLSNDFLSTSFSYDRNIESINSGIGVIAHGELAGEGLLWRSVIAPSYAYNAVIKEKVVVRPALKTGFAFTGVNKEKLVFNDQLESGSSSTVDESVRSNRFYFDFSAGVLVMSNKYWGGISFNHMNEPDQSLLENDSQDKLPMKTSVHTGAKFPLSSGGQAKSKVRDVSIVVHYKAQGKFDQLDIGGYYNTNPVVFGIWYRGLPVKSNHNNAINADALTLLLGFKKQDVYSLGFSYDMTISKLSFTRSAGSFEISFIREWSHKKKKRKKHFIAPCAKF